jgi:HK97 family phage prohead protease
MTTLETDRPAGELWHRAAELVGVSFPDRTIEMIVMPYETETIVPHEGRLVRETISKGAFDGIERRANRVRVNRDHAAERTVGRAVALHPSREEGLVAEVRIARTELGDETLTLADEGILDASAAFRPMPGGMKWESRDAYRIGKAWLGHIALTPDPAYPTARVLAVRSHDDPQPAVEREPTPFLDQVRADRLRDRYDLLSR